MVGPIMMAGASSVRSTEIFIMQKPSAYLFDSPQVIHEHTHQSQLVRKSHKQLRSSKHVGGIQPSVYRLHSTTPARRSMVM